MGNENNANEVIRFLKRKNSNGFDSPTYLGAEQRFVTGLHNSGVNNLEEQYIIGTDTYTEEYLDNDGNDITEISYHVNSVASQQLGYYKLIITNYKSGGSNIDFYIKDNQLVVPDSAAVFNEDILQASEKDVFTFNGESFSIYPASFTIVKKEELYYVTPSEVKLVLTKVVEKKALENGRIATKESIINNLK